MRNSYESLPMSEDVDALLRWSEYEHCRRAIFDVLPNAALDWEIDEDEGLIRFFLHPKEVDDRDIWMKYCTVFHVSLPAGTQRLDWVMMLQCACRYVKYYQKNIFMMMPLQEIAQTVTDRDIINHLNNCLGYE